MMKTKTLTLLIALLLPASLLAQGQEQTDDLSQLAPGVTRGVAFMCVNSSDAIDASDFGTVRCGSTRQLMVEAIQSGTWNVGTLTTITNPVSVTGTFWQATQPVSVAAAVTVAQATASSLNATVTDGSGAMTVDGTVTVGTFPDNEPMNVAQKGGSAVAAGPCEREVPLYAQVDQASGEQLITGTASERVYVCSIAIVTATAQNIALVDGTGTVCATSPTGLLGGSTAATGQNFAVNGGWVLPFNQGGWAKTSTDADNVCLRQSSTGQVSGIVTYVSVPNI